MCECYYFTFAHNIAINQYLSLDARVAPEMTKIKQWSQDGEIRRISDGERSDIRSIRQHSSIVEVNRETLTLRRARGSVIDRANATPTVELFQFCFTCARR